MAIFGVIDFAKCFYQYIENKNQFAWEAVVSENTPLDYPKYCQPLL